MVNILQVKDRKAALNFITVTPRQLIEKEGKEVKSVRVNVYAKEVRLQTSPNLSYVNLGPVNHLTR